MGHKDLRLGVSIFAQTCSWIKRKLRVSDLNGISRLLVYIIVEIYHCGQKPPKFVLLLGCYLDSSIGLAVCGGNTKCTDTGCLGTVYRYGSKCTGIPEPTAPSRGRTLSLSLCVSLTKMTAREEDELIVVRNGRGKANIWKHSGFKKRKTDNTLSLCLSLLPICPWQCNKEPSKPGVEVKLLTVAIDIRREREREQITATLCTPVYRCKIPVLGWNTGTVIHTGTQPYSSSLSLWVSIQQC